jgi:hypothetical protein
MTWTQLISLAINTAVAGTDADNNPILKQRLEGAAMTDQALHALATEIAGNPEIRSRLEKQFSVALTNGVGSIPAGMLTEYLREGVVRDSSGSGVNGLGNIFARVNRYSSFIQDQDTSLGLYCLVDNSIYARPPASTNPADTIGPLLIDAPFVPTSSTLSSEVPDEITDNLVEILARRLRGMIAPAESPV